MRASTVVRTGDLDTPIVVERKATSADPEYVAADATYGTENTVWVPLVRRRDDSSRGVTFWANFQDALPSRSESVIQGAETARNQTRIRMRWRDDIDSSMRIVQQATLDVYQIIGGPAMLGRRQFLEVQCERVGFLTIRRLLVEGGGALLSEGGNVLLSEDGKVLLSEDGKVLLAEGGQVLLSEAGKALLAEGGQVFLTEDGKGVLL